MAIQKKTANLFDFDTMSSGVLGNFIKSDGTLQAKGGWNTSDYVPCNGNTFTLTVPVGGVTPAICLYDSNKNYITGLSYNGNNVITVQSAIAASYIRFSMLAAWRKVEIMLNEGSTALPYEPYGWVHSLRKLCTETDTITTLPTELIADSVSAYTIRGNMAQSGTPTPSAPIAPIECGVLETTGEHSGQYKIPISSGGTTTNMYLGEVQSERRIKKYVCTGDESWTNLYGVSLFMVQGLFNSSPFIPQILSLSTHFAYNPIQSGLDAGLTHGEFALQRSGSNSYNIALKNTNYTSVEDFKAWLAAQYANGTPVTIWYVLATPTTGIVNEPIRKIGDYADSVSGSSIPTTGTAESFDVLTSLKPSEVSLTYHGWHNKFDTKF